MKKSDLKSKIKEEIIDILEAVTQDDVNTQQDYNAELEKTAKLSKDAGLTESLNPEVSKKVDQFIKAMAKRYDYEEKDAVFAIMAALKQRDFDVSEGNDSDKFQDDGYVNHTYDDQTIDKYNVPVEPTAVFEDDEDEEPTAAQLKKEPISKIGYKLADTQKEMKRVVKKWKDAEGSEKEKLTDRLRELTKIKKELESLLEIKK